MFILSWRSEIEQKLIMNLFYERVKNKQKKEEKKPKYSILNRIYSVCSISDLFDKHFCIFKILCVTINNFLEQTRQITIRTFSISFILNENNNNINFINENNACILHK